MSSAKNVGCLGYIGWSLGGSALLAAHATLIDVESPSPAYRDAMTALAYVEWHLPNGVVLDDMGR